MYGRTIKTQLCKQNTVHLLFLGFNYFPLHNTIIIINKTLNVCVYDTHLQFLYLPPI